MVTTTTKHETAAIVDDSAMMADDFYHAVRWRCHLSVAAEGRWFFRHIESVKFEEDLTVK